MMKGLRGLMNKTEVEWRKHAIFYHSIASRDADHIHANRRSTLHKMLPAQLSSKDICSALPRRVLEI